MIDTSSSRLEAIARALATHHHSRIGQVRKYTGEPYIVHPAAVVKIVRSVPHTEEMLAAAWLHDTVEDTEATLDEIERECGVDVAELVEMLTDPSRPEDGSRTRRKAIDRAHTAKASPAAKTVKLADLIDNTRSIVKADPRFARIWLDEKRKLLEVLREGDPRLWGIAAGIVEDELVDAP
jgi:(p)ppGpp synthase/HD superfamily hydrolase